MTGTIERVTLSSMTRIQMVILTCSRCGHRWTPRRPELPKRCPRRKCGTPYWDRPRKP